MVTPKNIKFIKCAKNDSARLTDSIITVMWYASNVREKDRNALNIFMYLEYFVFFPPQSWIGMS